MPSVSFSRAKLYRRCHKAYDYRYTQNIQRRRRAVPLVRGTILGKMLDERVAGKDPFKVLRKYEKEYAKLWLQEKEEYGDVIGDIRRLVEAYERKYANEGLKYLGTEVPIEVPLVQDIVFKGYVDKSVVDPEGRKFLMDHKSHANIPDDDQRFSDLQEVLYIWAWNKINPKDPVTGFIWDYIRTKAPTIPEQLKNGQLTQRANIDTDYWTYLAEIRRLRLDPAPYADTLMRLKKQSDRTFVRITLPNPPKVMLKTIVDELVDTALQIHSKKPATDRNMTQLCPSTCEFYNLCQAEVRGLDANYIRKSEYEERKDDGREGKKPQ